MVTRYCVGCHSTRNPLPAGAPLALDKANFADPGADALTWERVVRKLGVGAMPPQGSPTPGAAELARFRASLITSLDRAASRTKQPGQFVVHRLNRTEYGNAVRDLLGVTIDETDLLPSDGGDFGFDNVASALKTSPLMLDRYVAAGLHVAELAVGDASAEPGTATYTISTVVTQDQHVEGLPLGTRGGVLVSHTFPADGEYVFSGRLLKTVAEGLAGVEGHETPHVFVVTIDGDARLHGADWRKGGSRRGRREQAGTSRRVQSAHDVAANQSHRRRSRGGLHVRPAADAGTEHVAALTARDAGGAQSIRSATAA